MPTITLDINKSIEQNASLYYDKAKKIKKKKKALAPKKKAPKVRYKAGEDPEYAKRRGWPVKGPPPPPGRS